MTAAPVALPPAGLVPSAGRVLAVVCTYNEAENLPALVPAVLAADSRLDLLVVDDDSPDGTGDLADELARADPRVRTLRRTGKRGLGSATLAGLRAAVSGRSGVDGAPYAAAVTMDADFSHHPRHLPALLALLDTHGVAVGSRYVPGGGVDGWPLSRRAMSRAINVYTRLTLGLSQRDCSGAFRAYRADVLRAVDFGAVRSTGYAFQEEFLYRCAAAGAAIAETPITFADRTRGTSKIDAAEAVAALWNLGAVGAGRLRR